MPPVLANLATGRPPPTEGDWIALALDDPQSWRLAALFAVSALVIIWLSLTLAKLRPGRQATRPSSTESGNATIEFALVAPILLFFALILAQTTLTMTGNLFVHYAAFAATRSAIVHIPSQNELEPMNTLVEPGQSPKHRHIQAAAAIALIPVAGRLPDSEGGSPDAQAFAQALNSHYAAYGQASPGWVDKLAADRYRYAFTRTEATVMRTLAPPRDMQVAFAPIVEYPYTFGPKEPITVEVRHKLNLAVPYVRWIFDDEDHTGQTWSERVASSGKYTLVHARYTLTNEGIIDDLPPKPPLPRDN